MLSRFVCSMPNRSTCGVCAIAGGKCPPMPTGATKPGPRIVRSETFGFDCISRCVIVDWLMFRIVREVSGPTVGKSPAGSTPVSGSMRESAVPLAKNAAVRAFATAPSIAKTSVASSAGSLMMPSALTRLP